MIDKYFALRSLVFTTLTIMQLSSSTLYAGDGSMQETSTVPGTWVTAIGTLQLAMNYLSDLTESRTDQIRAGDSWFLDSNKAGNVTVWVSNSADMLANKLNSTRYNAGLWTSTLGIEALLGERHRLGIGAGYEWDRINTPFNNGYVHTKGVTVLPYWIADFGDGRMIATSLGYTHTNYDLLRQGVNPDGSTALPTGTAQAEGYRIFGGAHMAQECSIDRYRVLGQMGLFVGYEHNDGFTESLLEYVSQDDTEILEIVPTPWDARRTKDARFNIGGTIGYDLQHLTPYILSQLNWDFVHSSIEVADDQEQPARAEVGLQIGLGLNVNFTQRVSLRIEATKESLRDNDSRYFTTGTFRIRL